jgi:nicotinamidase-related amidase
MDNPMPMVDLASQSKQFVDWLSSWYSALQPLPLESAISDPARTAVCTVDMLNGFCYEGTLSSPRAAACVKPIADLYRRAHALRVRNFVSIQEWHSESAKEFEAFAAHCIRETREAMLVPELAELPFAREITVVHKNSLHAIVSTRMEEWLDEHPSVDTFIATGVCTDLCTFDLAMDLKLRANARDLPRQVIVPANAVSTYDLPVATALKMGALPHDANLLHAMFLYMMALNKITVVKELV